MTVLSAVPSLVIRSFDAAADLERVVAWTGLDTPAFIERTSGQNPAVPSRAFLAAAAGGDEFLAVTYPKGAGFQGPVAALHCRFGERASLAYLDPAFRDQPALARGIEHLIETTPSLRGTPAPQRLVA